MSSVPNRTSPNIPGAYPEESRANTGLDRNIDAQEGYREEIPEPKLVKIFVLLLHIPFLLIFYAVSAIIFISQPFRSCLNFSEFYRRKYRHISDHDTESERLLETLSQDCHSLSAAAYNFGSIYNNSGSVLSPSSISTSYTSLLEACTEQCRFGLIYLHGPLLDNSLSYASNILCSEEFVKIIKKFQVLLWFGDTTTSEGLQVANALKVRHFPFIGILCLKDKDKIEMIGRAEALLENYNPQKLESVLQKYHSTLMKFVQIKKNDEMERLIRVQQDSRFRESLRRDQERDRQRVEEGEHLLQQQRRERQRKQWLLRRKNRLSNEPDPNVDSCRVAIKISDHERIIRRFNASLPIEEIYAFVELHREGLLDSSENYYIDNDVILEGYNHEYGFLLLSPAPRKELDQTLTIREEQSIYPSGTIVLETIESAQ